MRNILSDSEVRQRLAETFDLLVARNSKQRQNQPETLPVFSKEPIFLNFEASITSGHKTERKGA